MSCYHGSKIPGPSCLKADWHLTWVSFSCALPRIILEIPIINLLTKTFTTEMLFKLSNLNLNFALTLGYLNPALNNSPLDFNDLSWQRRHLHCWTMEEKCCSWVQSCTKSYMSIFFCHICRTVVCWDPEILLSWHCDVMTAPLYCLWTECLSGLRGVGWGAVIPLSAMFLLSLDSFTLEESRLFLDQFMILSM